LDLRRTFTSEETIYTIFPEEEISGGLAGFSQQRKAGLGMAVRVRFELTEPVKVQRFSRPPHSTTLPPHRAG
jgi:hypothetical protein